MTGTMRSTGRRLGIATLAIGLAAIAAACDGEDRPGVEVIDEGGSGTASGSGTGTGTGSGTGSGTASGTGAFPDGVVEPKPDGATQVDVTLAEWNVTPAEGSAAAGEVYFLASNEGEDPHELVVVKSDLEPGDLPVEEGAVVEDELDFRGEIEGFASGTQASGVFDLEAGRYVLFCTIVEEEDGGLESHYELGMHTEFTVE
jgi:uncharacterized cupredoxin-like copper-binding protein